MPRNPSATSRITPARAELDHLFGDQRGSGLTYRDAHIQRTTEFISRSSEFVDRINDVLKQSRWLRPADGEP